MRPFGTLAGLGGNSGKVKIPSLVVEKRDDKAEATG